MRTIYIVGMIALLGAMMVMPASATTWDVYEGDSIQAALNNVSDGDTVLVHAGTYELTESDQEWQLCVNTPNITLKGECADVVTLDASGKGAIYLGPTGYEFSGAAPGCIVEGFRIINSNLGVNILVNSPNCIVRNNLVEAGTAVNVKASNTTIRGNVMNGGSKCIQFRVGPITFVDNVVSNSTKTYASVKFYIPDAVIVNNTFRDNFAGMGIYNNEATNITVARNNFISSGAGIKLYGGASGNRIYLNNFVNNTENVLIGGSDTPINIWNSTGPITYTYNGNPYTNYLGNYWGSDYTGSDGDGDGLGDAPYDIPGSATDKDHRPLMTGFENYISEEAPPAPTPPTSFLISGNVSYDNGNPVTNPMVTVRNMDTSEDFTVKTAAGSNHYLTLTDSSHVSAGDWIRINASDDTVYNETSHIVMGSEIESGGFVQDMLLESGERPDLIVTEKSEEWVTVDKTYTTTYTVENSGTFNAGASTIAIEIDGTEVATDPVPALAIGESYTSTLGPFTLSGENDTIRVCADNDEIVSELNETNNCLENLLEVSGLPDLTIQVALKTPGYTNEENILGVKAKNTGSGDAGSFNVSLSIDGTPVLLETVSSLAVNEITELEYTWTPASTGEYAMSATADTNNDVTESDETNNDYARTSVIIKRTDWHQFHYDGVHSGFSPSGASNTNTTLWISEELSAIGGTSTVVAAGRVFAYGGPTSPYGSGEGVLYCLDEFTGAILWNISIPTPAYGSWSSPAYHNGRVFTSTGIEAGCYNATTGEQIWVFENPTGEASVNGGPVVADGKVIVNDWQAGHFYCLDEEAGELLWNFTETKTGNWGVGYAQGVPAYEAGRFYLTTWLYVGGNVYCVDADTGELIWNKTTPLDTCGSPVVVDGTVYVTNYDFYGDGAIYAMDAGNGDILWSQTIQRSDSTPAVAYGNVYVCGGCSGYSQMQTYCFNATTGNPIWSTDTGDEIGAWTCSVAVADDKVFVGHPGSLFGYAGTYALDAATGDVIWSHPGGGSSPAVADDIVFTIGGGRVYAFCDPLPDLTIAAIGTPTNLRNDVINPITATVENIGGTNAENFVVSLDVDGIQVDTTTIATLAAGDSTTVEFLWTPASTGGATLTVTADADDSVEELDEMNNDLPETVDVLEKLTVTANVRIEGKDYTVWTGDVTFSNSMITASDGSIHYLNEPTALGALDEADKLGGFGYVLVDYGWGLYIEEVAGEPPIGWDGWMYRVNYVSPWVGAPDYTLADSDEVLWYFGAWTAPPLKIELGKTTVMAGEEFVVTVTADFGPVDNATVYANELTFQTGSDGTATLALDTAGNYIIYADKGTWADYTRSEKKTVLVVMLAGVTFDKKKLDLNSSGILKAFITLPEGYDVADIDVSTVECEGAHAFGDGSVIPGKQALEVKFKIPDLVDVPTGDAVSLTVSGELTTGERFEGSNTVKVITK
ncbi:MAG: Outer membrane protein assembly factor BamB [Candidatus Argoarchaeum ethanivorans]|uniref:Outer membrane protein assembly factor BamB n=1 Tax=Candidatus Argoarchaeum ethanivorans TaxID=2608793 RepID=A0A811TBG8_9EURY|nr:MAG: Outer membrane protein assembly factor BamB [Candidatus Argoarchaeum ethanivorans]